MKKLVTLVRIVVGILFIFSGLVKANDPLGLSYKMQEFFEIWNTGLASTTFFLSKILISTFHFLHEYSLALSVILIAFEIIAGAALLLGWRMKIIGKLLLAMIVFFTFLTAYAYFSGKFKNCGCFGDCLPITPATSFFKDIILTILIVFLILKQNLIQPLFTRRPNFIAILAVILFSFGFQWYVLTYLPVIDCLPYKVSNNIKEKMKIPAGAITDSFSIRFIYEKEGKRFEFSPAELPSDLGSYKYVDRLDKQIRKGNAEPPIKGFALTDANNNDYTSIVLAEEKCLLLFSENLSLASSNWQNEMSKVYAHANKLNIPVYLVTTSIDVAQKTLSNTTLTDMQIFKCDFTAIRTAARANPALYFLKKGTIVHKWSYKQFTKAIQAMNNAN